MKKRMAMAMALALICAPHTLAEPAPEGDFFDDLRSMWQSVEQGAIAFGDAAKTFITDGAEDIGRRITAWGVAIDEYLDTHGAQWAQEIQQAWETLREAARNATDSEEAEAAYQRLREWLEEAGESVDEGVDDMLESLGRAAGVIQDKTARCLERIEATLSDGPEAGDEVEAAWRLLRSGVENPGLASREEMEEARGVVAGWLEALDTELAAPALEALEDLQQEEMPDERR